jgi:hypothetical protein
LRSRPAELANESICRRGEPGYKLAKRGGAMLGACLAYIGISLMLGIFLVILGFRHRTWSRTRIARGPRSTAPPSRQASSDR